MRLDLEDLAGREGHEFAGFGRRLVEALPGMREPRGGRPFAAIVEHVAVELAGRAGMPADRSETVAVSPPGVFDICVECPSEPGMRRVLETAVELVQALVDGRPYPLRARVAEAIEVARERDLDPSTRAIVDAAENRGIPWSRLGDGRLIQLGYGRSRKFIQTAMGSQTSAIAVTVANDQALTKTLLSRAGVPAPKALVVESAEQAVAALEEIGPPVAIQPLDAPQGKGVSLDLWTAEQATYAYEIASPFSRRVVVEQMIRGRDYRVLVVNGAVAAACERIPAGVVGDGRSTVQELIEAANRDPRRGAGDSRPGSAIRVDRVCLAALGKQGYQLESVPPEGCAVYVGESANGAAGGTSVDVTADAHPSMALICERAARAVGLDICGVDLVVDDIAAPFTEGGVVALNAAPDIHLHHCPNRGEPRDVASRIVRGLYPDGNGRIPIVSITGETGNATVTRLIAHILGGGNRSVGVAAGGGVWIGGRQIVAGCAAGRNSAATVLFDPEVDLAVLETAHDGIVRDGLGYDWSDVAVATGAAPDDREGGQDLLRSTVLVAERVRDGGTLVLNAEDERLRGIPRQAAVARVPKRIAWYAFEASHPRLEEARREGGTVYYVGDGHIQEGGGEGRLRLMAVDEIPLTRGGTARGQVANAMAAVAACRAMGAGVAQVRAGLRSFLPAERKPARAQAFEAGRALSGHGRNRAAAE